MEQTRIDKIVKTPGQVRGAVFQTDAAYIKRHFGEEKLVLIKDRLKEWGTPIDYEKIQAMEWFPAGLRAMSLLAIKDVLKFDEEQIRQMGNEAPKHSFMIKLVMKFFLSLEKVFNLVPDIWRRHWTAGEIELGEYNKEARTMIFRIKGLDLDPVFCKYEEGYFQRIAQYVENAKCREVKCSLKGGPCHEYLVSWQ